MAEFFFWAPNPTTISNTAFLWWTDRTHTEHPLTPAYPGASDVVYVMSDVTGGSTVSRDVRVDEGVKFNAHVADLLTITQIGDFLGSPDQFQRIKIGNRPIAGPNRKYLTYYYYDHYYGYNYNYYGYTYEQEYSGYYYYGPYYYNAPAGAYYYGYFGRGDWPQQFGEDWYYYKYYMGYDWYLYGYYQYHGYYPGMTLVITITTTIQDTITYTAKAFGLMTPRFGAALFRQPMTS